MSVLFRIKPTQQLGILEAASQVGKTSVEILQEKQARLHKQLLHRQDSFRSLILQELQREQQVCDCSALS